MWAARASGSPGCILSVRALVSPDRRVEEGTMAPISAYHRPTSLNDTLALLDRPGVVTRVLAGGTALNPDPGDTEEVVDLQALGLDAISIEGPVLSYGATTTLRGLVDHDRTPPLLAELARREAPNTIRNAATIGGTVATASPESAVLAGLVAMGATVRMVGGSGETSAPIAEALADVEGMAGKVLTAVEVPIDGIGWHADTGRTPADTPIVLVAGHRPEGGVITLAATGVGPTPVEIDLDRLDDLDPPDDFRGTPDYRRHLARALAVRVTERLQDEGAS